MTRNLMLLGAILHGLVIVLGCGGDAEDDLEFEPSSDAEGPTEVEMVAAMEAHYSSTILAHDALIQGDLSEFRAQLAETSAHELPANSPELWKPFETQLRDAATKAVEATNLSKAAKTMAEVVLACGACHQGVGTGPIYPAPAPRDGDNPVQQSMLEHQWATERLWEGITGPWDNAWERGSAALAETRVFSDLESAEARDESLLVREAALRSLGEDAKTTSNPRDRAELYGRLLATCGDCHQAMNVKLPPYK